jgi:hypothetical protein
VDQIQRELEAIAAFDDLVRFPQMAHHLLNRMFPSARRLSFLSSMSIEQFADTCQESPDRQVP